MGKRALMLCIVAAALAQPGLAEEEIRFAPKAFFNGSGESVEVSGTLTGAGVGYPNNTHVVYCLRQRKACFVTAVEADKNYVSRVTGPDIIPIISWTDNEIVAKEEPHGFGCSRTTITIARKQGMLLWVQEPINQTTAYCAKSETRVLKWTIEDPAYYKRMR